MAPVRFAARKLALRRSALCSLRLDQAGITQVGPVQAGAAQIRARQVGCAQVRAAEARAAQVAGLKLRVRQDGAGEVGAFQARLSQVGVRQVGVAEVGAGQVRRADGGLGEVGAAQDSAAQARATQVSLAQVGVMQVSPAQVCAAQVLAGEILVAQVAAAEVAAGEVVRIGIRVHIHNRHVLAPARIGRAVEVDADVGHGAADGIARLGHQRVAQGAADLAEIDVLEVEVDIDLGPTPRPQLAVEIAAQLAAGQTDLSDELRLVDVRIRFQAQRFADEAVVGQAFGRAGLQAAVAAQDHRAGASQRVGADGAADGLVQRLERAYDLLQLVAGIVVHHAFLSMLAGDGSGRGAPGSAKRLMFACSPARHGSSSAVESPSSEASTQGGTRRRNVLRACDRRERTVPGLVLVATAISA